MTAPFDGRIGRRLVDPGNLVGAGEFTLLAEVNQIDPLYVYFTINERDLLRVMGETGISAAEAQKIKMPLYFRSRQRNGLSPSGLSGFRRHQPHPHHRHPALRGIFPNPDGKILPGLFARVRAPIVGSEKTALLIPEVAIGYDQLGSYVLVVDDKNVVERRSVKLGARVDDRRVVEEGLTGDEWVIVQRAVAGLSRQAGDPRPEGRCRQSRNKTGPVPPPASQGKPPHDLQVLHRAAHLRQRHRHRHHHHRAGLLL